MPAFYQATFGSRRRHEMDVYVCVRAIAIRLACLQGDLQDG